MLNKMKKNKKGFTLMEMLIVVAIIAVLVAIAIPTFSNALTKSKEAADVANLRALYAEWQIGLLTETSFRPSTSAKYLLGPGGKENISLNFASQFTYDNTNGEIKYVGTKIGTYTWNLNTID